MIFRCTRQTLGRAQSGAHVPVRGASPRGEDLELAVQDLEQRWVGGLMSIQGSRQAGRRAEER